MLALGIIVVVGLALLLFFLTSPGQHLVDVLRPKPDFTNPDKWTIGPIVNGENKSLNMPLHPGPGFVIDMPRPECQPHYVTADYGSLQGRTRITLKGRVEGGPLFAKDGVSQASICLYFQRQFDDWWAIDSDPYKDTDTESYRWYATSKALLPLVAGEFKLSASVTDLWTAVLYSKSQGTPPKGKPGAFKKAWDNAGEVGFVLGGGDGWGHGIMSPNPSRIIVTSFEVA